MKHIHTLRISLKMWLMFYISFHHRKPPFLPQNMCCNRVIGPLKDWCRELNFVFAGQDSRPLIGT